MTIRFRSRARKIFFADQNKNEPQLVDVWEHLEAIRDGRHRCPCQEGRTCHEYVECAQDRTFILLYYRPERNVLELINIRTPAGEIDL